MRIKIETWHNIDKEDLVKCKNGGGGYDPFLLARLLESKSCLKDLIVYPKLSLFFIYDRKQGIYVEMGPSEIKSFISKLAFSIDLKISRAKILLGIYNEILYGPLSDTGEVRMDRGKEVFPNGTLDLGTGLFGPWDPSHFITHRKQYKYDPQGLCPKIIDFLLEMCEGHLDRLYFLRCWLNSVVRGDMSNQIFVYIWGPGGTGKSTLTHLITALVGKAGVMTTSLKSLHSDPFEAYNLIGKKLILISDTEFYKGDLSVLKGFTGGDSVKGRIKYVQGSFEVVPEGNVLIVGNYPLGTRDTTDSIVRRVREFPIQRIIFNRKYNLITLKGNDYEGELVEELPGFYNWVLSVDSERVNSTLGNPKGVKSLVQVQRDMEERANPVLQWVRQEVEPGEGSYLGYKLGEGLKQDLEISRRKVLFPTYERWAHRNDLPTLSHVVFSQALLACLKKEEGFVCEKVKREKGIYFTGISIKRGVYDRDYIYGAPLSISREENPQSGTIPEPLISPIPQSKESTNDNNDKKSIQIRSINDSLPLLGEVDSNLYSQYISKLQETPLKRDLNNFSKSIDIDLDKLVNRYCRDCNLLSNSFASRLTTTLTRGKDKLSRFGAIPYHYKQMGTSPRILPQSYGDSINNVKQILRHEIYTYLGQYSKEVHNMRIIDLDLISCYTSILIGLFPQELQAIQIAIEGRGLWKFIQEEFEANGQAEAYNKKAVKICTYSSFFQGGNRAMMEGILENFRKEAGVTPEEFKNMTFYEDCYKIAQDVTTEMQNSSVIADFRAVSTQIFKQYNQDFLMGPTGHKYFIDQESFRSAYPNILQSYEFALLARATLESLASYSNAELIGHYHDGNVLIVPENQVLPIIDSMNDSMSRIGEDLGLRYPQKLECKNIYPPLSTPMY